MTKDSKFEIRDDRIGAVLVCGAGIAGIQASLDLAGSGFKVYLLDSGSAIGGRMAQLDKTFPTGDCAMCVLSPKLVECARNRNIEIMTLTDVQSVTGDPGSFTVRVRQNPRYVDIKRCESCGNCAEACPVTLPNEFEGRIGTRKAIFKPYAQAIPNVMAISKAAGQAPCKADCPAGVNVQGFIALLAAGKFTEAYELLRLRCPLPASCGRVCLHPCENNCNRETLGSSVSVAGLERFLADHFCSNPEQLRQVPQSPLSSECKIAVIGSGPAGLTAAADLVRMGHAVTLFEAKRQLGGMLRYGIPAYRLPKDVLDREIQFILDLGVEIKTNTPVNRPKDLLKSSLSSGGDSDTSEGFDAVFVGTGAWVSGKLGVPGEDAVGVWGVLDFLVEVNAEKVPQIGPKVLVIGSSDPALDAARSALRVPGVNSVHLACIESRAEMPAQSEQLTQALTEGIIFHNGLGPTRIVAENGNVSSVRFRACTSVFDNYRGYKRYNPLFDDSQITSLQADTVIVATDRRVDSLRFEIETRPGGRILTHEKTLATSIRGVFAGGDAVLGPASVVDAMAQGHQAAEAIDSYLKGTANIRSAEVRQFPFNAAPRANPGTHAPNPRPDAPIVGRIQMPQTEPEDRLRGTSEINLGYSLEQALSEARRCLSCGLCSECMQCTNACSAGAILHDQLPAQVDIEVGSIILASGMEEFKAFPLDGLDFSPSTNVLSGMEFEHVLSAAVPAGGHLRRPSDGTEIKRIAFIQCVGSRNLPDGKGYCSSVCCMSAAKQAVAAQESVPGTPLDISIFGTDVLAFGKEFDSYIHRVRDEYGVRYVRARPFRITELQGSGNLRVSYADPTNSVCVEEFDLVVLSTAIRVSKSVQDMAKRLGLDLNSLDFLETERLSPLATSRPGIYVAGALQEPKDIPESAAQGSAAAACAMEQLTAVRGTMIQRQEYPWERDTADEPPRVGVFVCHCGHNISSVVDVERVAREAAKLPNVHHAESNVYTCSEASQQHIKEMIHKHRLNRLVVASCSSRTHEILFQETLRESGLNQYLFAMTNIRDQCSWVHRDDPATATVKAMDLVSMAVARARHLKQLPLYELPVTASALIMGGGLAGMTAAHSIAAQGFKVHLVERQGSLGGMLRTLHTTLENTDVQDYLRKLIEKTRSNPNIKVYLNSELKKLSGQAGNFTSVLNVAGTETAVTHGVVIVATGGRERPTSLFLHGRNKRVVTQSRLESLLADDSLLSQLGGIQNPKIVMIQCVESRDEKNPYCSRVCCAEAVKNALEIKRRFPLSRIVIIGRDIRTYGFRETYYRKALQQGVRIIRHPDDNPPEVMEVNDRPEVKAHDILTDQDFVLDPDLLVLSTGISPAADNPELSTALRTALTGDGFFLEAHPKLRPVDLANEGEFLCGVAHSPRFMDETIAQALAAAARASTILSKAQLEIMGQLAVVNPAECVACATCVKVCPYGAPKIGELRKAEVQTAKCMGCGSCAAACPSRAIYLQHQEREGMVAMLDELLVSGGSL